MQSHSRSILHGLGVVLAVVAALATFVASAAATFPGRNGVIAYVTNHPAGTNGIATIDPVTGSVREIVTAGQHPAWSADGKRLAFARAGAIWVANANGSKQTRLTSGSDDTMPSWSPNGRRIVFARDNGLWVRRSNGRRQASLNTQGLEPAWSPDGRRIAYYNDLATWTMASDGTDRRLLASALVFPDDDATWIPSKPDWSPDGREVVVEYVYNGPCDGCFRLARVPAGGGAPVEIPGSYPAGAPSWSPDGREIAAHAVEGLRSLALANGATSRYLLTGDFFEYAFPAWQPLPARGRPAR